MDVILVKESSPIALLLNLKKLTSFSYSFNYTYKAYYMFLTYTFFCRPSKVDRFRTYKITSFLSLNGSFDKSLLVNSRVIPVLVATSLELVGHREARRFNHGLRSQ